MANMKLEIDGKVYDFVPESFAIDNEGNIILKSKPSAEKKRNPFKRVKEGEDFYYIGGYEQLMTMKECSLFYADRYYDCANYCTDEELLRRRALYEKLERCLWRFSMENGGSGNYYPILNKESREWLTVHVDAQRFGPSFKTREACESAIEEVIKPMLDGIAEEEIFSWKGV